jgi:hypothetical protein
MIASGPENESRILVRDEIKWIKPLQRMTNQSSNKHLTPAFERDLPQPPVSSQAHSTQPSLHSELTAYALTCCPRLYECCWWELAETLISSINASTELCAQGELPMAEIKALWLAHVLVFQVVVRREAEWRSDPAEAARLRAQWGTIEGQLRAIGVDSPLVRTQIIIEREDWYHRQELCRLQAAMQSFAQAFYGRAAHTPRAKYAEARRAGHRALMMDHNPLLDGFPHLVEILREVCSGEVATYVTTEVQLPNDQFLDALEVIGRDRSDPAEVANPPARIRLSLSRKQRRRQRLERQRCMPLEEEPTSGLESRRWSRP